MKLSTFTGGKSAAPTILFCLLAGLAMLTGHHIEPSAGIMLAGFGVTVNQTSLSNAYTSFNTIFQGAFDGTATILDKLRMVVPSTTAKEEYKWLGQFPGMREWVGDRAAKALSVEGFTIRNKDFEATITVDRNDIEDDTIGVYRPLFEQLGATAKQHPDQLLAALLISGFTELCFDKTAFFNAAHPNGTQSAWGNLLTGGSSALSSTSYDLARTTMSSLANEEGRSLRIVPNLLIVPPQLESVARTLLRADKMANGATNIWQNSADLLMVPELAAFPKRWFLTDVSRSAKPFVYQERKAPEFVALDKLTDDNVFFRKEYVYGVDSRCNAGFALPQLMLASLGE